jgi:hypothetical protein
VSPRKQTPVSRQSEAGTATAAAPVDFPAVSVPAGGVGNVDQIRDILFGTQMRNYEKRFVRLEERLSKELTQLREDTRKQFSALETFFKNELEELIERLAGEQKERTLRDEQLGAELEALSKALEAKAAELDEKLTKTARDIRQQLLGQSKTLSDDIQAKYAELSASLEREAEDLRTAKLDRSKLSEMLTQLALNLTNEQAFHLGIKAGDSDND